MLMIFNLKMKASAVIVRLPIPPHMACTVAISDFDFS